MAEGDVRQYWVRNDRGTLWGPLTLPTIELLIDSGAIKGKLQVSEDGLNFAFPWRFPEAREVFPRELWGDGAPANLGPGPQAPVARPGVPMAGPGGVPMAGPGAAPMAGPGVPMAGPGVPMAGPGAAPMAGPGAAPMAGPGAAPIARPGVPMAGPGAPMAGPGATGRPGVPMAGPGAPMAGPGATGRPGVPMAGPGVPMAGPGAPMAGPGAPVARPGVPMAGPGAPMAGPGVPMAGPGVRPGDPRAQGNPMQAARPQVPGAAPGAPGAVARPVAPPNAATGQPQVATPQAGAVPPAAPFPSTAAAPAVSTESSPYAMPSQGQLEQTSPLNLFGRIASAEQTGLLKLALTDRVTLIHFRKGNPEFVDSNHPEDSLGTSLMGARLLTPEQLQQAESAKERFGGDLLAALFGLGLLQPASAFSILAQRASSILFKGLRAESGMFAFELRELAGNKAMPLGNRWAVLSDTVRRMPSADIKRRLMPVLNLPIMKSGGMVAASELRLTPHEVRALTVIDGVRSVSQLLADFPQDADHLLRLAFLLRELDAVSFAAARPAPATVAGPTAAAQPGPAPTAGPTAAPRPAPPPGAQAPTAAPGNPPGAGSPQAARPGNPPGAAAPAAARPGNPPGAAAAPRPPPVVGAAPARPASPAPAAAARPAPPTVSGPPPGADEIPALKQLAMALKQQNHFQRLGLAEQADGSAVKVAYFRLAKLYHPDTLPQGAPPELEKLKAEVFAYIGDAYRTLSDDKSRAAYLEELKSGGAGAEVDINAILMAEELFQKSCILVKARKFPEAVKMLNEAIQLNAEEAEFYAWRGYARFFTATDKKAAQPEAFREIQNAIKRNERCAPAHYFLGVIAKLTGDTAGALKHFKRTVELQPDHIDAQREIRMAAQKK
ncbi:DnaJ domain-containing protein [Myxococcus sp. AS-1-15]|nr:DnaJ domain-containing protein [Myxococcus sp. AS-1-15]MBZ4397686.1 DnaJ domain-containing protein [Myxococcus sp. AS-1-15]